MKLVLIESLNQYAIIWHVINMQIIVFYFFVCLKILVYIYIQSMSECHFIFIVVYYNCPNFAPLLSLTPPTLQNAIF